MGDHCMNFIITQIKKSSLVQYSLADRTVQFICIPILLQFSYIIKKEMLENPLLSLSGMLGIVGSQTTYV